MLAEVEQKIDLRNLDKSDWKSYRFDEIAHNISERVDPNNTDLEVYIGLEHIDSESIHIKRFGTRDDVNGQKLRFYPGDVIFGRRRAYQRKAGIAETNGFCSAHALVLRANPEVIDPNLFPFFMHSDAFMNRAVDISVGSLSPTINWGSLKKQEFLLPPKAQQEKLAELLWSMDAVVQKRLNLRDKLTLQLEVTGKKYFSAQNANRPLFDLIEKTVSGGTPDTKQMQYYEEGSIPWVTSKVIESDYMGQGEKYITETAIKESAAKVLPSMNILAGTRVGIGKFAINSQAMSFSQDVTGLIVTKDVDLEFLLYQLQSSWVQSKIISKARGTTIKGITRDDLLGLKLFVPDLEAQHSIRRKFKAIKSSIKKSEAGIKHSQQLQKSLIMKVF